MLAKRRVSREEQKKGKIRKIRKKKKKKTIPAFAKTSRNRKNDATPPGKNSHILLRQLRKMLASFNVQISFLQSSIMPFR
jgi:hypothetical protein